MSEEDRNLLFEMRANCMKYQEATTTNVYDDEKRFKKGKAIENVLIENDNLKEQLNKQKEVLDKIKEYIKEWREDDGSGSYGTLDLLELLEEIK